MPYICMNHMIDMIYFLHMIYIKFLYSNNLSFFAIKSNLFLEIIMVKHGRKYYYGKSV